MKTKNRNKTAQKLKRRQRNGFRNKTKKLRSKKQHSRQRFHQMGGRTQQVADAINHITKPLPTPSDKRPTELNIAKIRENIKNAQHIIEFTRPDQRDDFGVIPHFTFFTPEQINGITLLYAVCRMRPFTEEVSGFIYYLARAGYVNNVSNERNGSLPQHGLVQTLVDILGDTMLTPKEKYDQIKWIRASLHTLYSYGAIMSAKNTIGTGFTALEEFNGDPNLKDHLDRLDRQSDQPPRVSKFNDIRHLLTPEPDILVPLIIRGDIVKHINADMGPPYYFFVVDNVRYYFCDEINKLIAHGYQHTDVRSQSLFRTFEFNHKKTNYRIEGTTNYEIEAIETEYSNEIVTAFGHILIKTADNKKVEYQLNVKNKNLSSVSVHYQPSWYPHPGYPHPGYPPSGYPPSGHLPPGH